MWMAAGQECGLFDGASGKLVLVSLSCLAFASYVGIFALRRGRSDMRTWQVFWLDLSKIMAGQLLAYLVNVINDHRNAGMQASSDFGPVAWYFPTFLNDEALAVPVGVAMWQGLTASARAASARFPGSQVLLALRRSGCYCDDRCAALVVPSPSPGRYYSYPVADEAAVVREDGDTSAACGPAGVVARCGCHWLAGRCGWSDDRVRYDWWLVQLFWWVVCVLLSRLLGGLFVPLCDRLFGRSSPYYMLAQWIAELPWLCDVKRWTFAGAFRVAVDVAQLAFVDAFNKFRDAFASNGATTELRAAIANDWLQPQSAHGAGTRGCGAYCSGPQ